MVRTMKALGYRHLSPIDTPESLLAIAVLLVACHGGAKTTTPTAANEGVQTAEVVARLPQSVGNVTFTPDGRMIFSHHPFFDPSIRVAELDATGTSARPFPNLEWNTPKAGTDEYLDAVLGVRGDEAGVVWMLDMGTRAKVTPKLVGWNTRANRLERIYRIPSPASLEISQHNDFVVDRRHGAFYIADEGIAHGGDGSRAALVVVDMATGQARRLLEGDASTRAENVPIVAEGVTLTVPGKGGAPTPLLVGADGICMDSKFEWLYFGPLNGRWVYRVRTADLRDASLSEAALRARVERYAEKPNNGGMSIDDAGNLYLTEVGTHAVGVIPQSSRRYRRFAEHPGLIWPDGVSFGKDGFLYVSAAQVNRAFGGASAPPRAPFLILRFRPLAPGRLGH